MRHYYVLNLNMKNINISKEKARIIDREIKLHIQENISSCLNYNKLKFLNKNLDIPFCNLLMGVFIEYANLEIKFRKILSISEGSFKRFKESEENLERHIRSYHPNYMMYINYIKEILKSTKDYTYYEKKIALLKRVQEDFDPNYENNYFERAREKGYEGRRGSVLILLNSKQEYIGHIYVSSWLLSRPLSSNDDINTFTFVGIRTSVRNLLVSEDKYIATTFITALKQYAHKYNWTSLEVSISPIGTMEQNLEKCGFVDSFAKLEDIKCNSPEKVIELNSNCDIYSADYYSNLTQKMIKCRRFFNSFWIDPKVVYDICELIIRSYSDKEITPDLIIDTYKVIVEYKPGYKPYLYTKSITDIKGFTEALKALDYFPEKEYVERELDKVDSLNLFLKELPDQINYFNSYSDEFKNTPLIIFEDLKLDKQNNYYIPNSLENILIKFTNLTEKIGIFIDWFNMAKLTLTYTNNIKRVKEKMESIEISLNSFFTYKKLFKDSLDKIIEQLYNDEKDNSDTINIFKKYLDLM